MVPPSRSDQTIITGSGGTRQTPAATLTERAGGWGETNPELAPGTVLANRYEILSVLGTGGMGSVYKAQDRELDRLVALKVIRPELARNSAIVDRFKQEIRLSHKVTHRNVVRMYDLSEDAGMRFVTMELVAGRDLRNILEERGKLPPDEAVETLQQICFALQAAHGVGILHRDLKPQNVMREDGGRVVVMDFGLARTIENDKGMTQTGALVGTMDYMSPEQALGKDLDQRSDIFTLGLIGYEMLTGAMPFLAESAIASLVKRTQQRAVPMAEIDRNIPGALSNIIAKCLEKDPANRYQNAEELDADLRAWQGKDGGKRVSASSARLRMNRIRELPWPRLAVTGVLIVAIAGGISWYVIKRQQGAKSVEHGPISVLVGDFENHTGDPVLDGTLEPMFGVALEGASFVNAYSREDARKLAMKLPNPSNKLDEQTARLVAVNQDVNTVVTGEIDLRGDEYEISAIALDAVSGKVLARADVTVANKQDILSSLPKLAVPIRKVLGDTTPASVQFDEVSGGFKAASLEAVHQEALAIDEQFAGKFQEAFDEFQKAVQLDPKFARPYTGMAAMDENLGKSGDAVKYMKVAMQHMDSMTERERYRSRGMYYSFTGDWQNCVQEYTQLVTHFPADRVGQWNLASCYAQLRNAPKALEAAQHAVEIVPRGVAQRLNLSFISSFAGDFAAGEKEARAGLAINPSAAQGFLVLAEAQLGEGQIDQATESYHQLEKIGALPASTATAGLADLAAYQGKYAEAATILTNGAAADVAAKNTDNAARKYAALGNIEELQGKHAAAVSDTGKALANSQTTQIEFLAANTYVDAGETAKAQKLATSLSSALTGESQAYGKIITGMIALKRKDANEAIRQITAANNLIDTWIGHFDLGQAYLEAGAFTEADSEFDQCAKRRGEAIELFLDNVPTYAYFPPVYYYQGRVRQGMNSEGFAEFYKTYLSIRGQSADDPLVRDIQHRILLFR
jgi:tRNA A-37 threonylcarbamoyl transferase component Bud32/Flp pilus assembly protein TadD